MKAAAHATDTSAPTRNPSASATTSAPAIFPGQISSLTDVLLQRSATCACGGGCPLCEESANLKLQTKLAVSSPGDKFEQEADAVADQVMRMTDPVEHTDNPGLSPTEEPQILRLAHGASGGEVASDFTSRLGTGTPLDTASRTYFESRFGYDFGGVRLHTDQAATDTARAIQARAYTLGRDIVFGAGEYEPSTFAGKRLLAHELAHVVQQSSHAGPMAQRQASALSPLSQRMLQRTTQFTPGVAHNHQPSHQWGYVQSHPNSGFLIGWACRLYSPRRVAELAIWRQFGDKPTALRHLLWYLNAGHGRDFSENENFERFVRQSEHFRRNFAVMRRGRNRGFIEVPQAFFGANDQDFRFSFGAIDRLDYEFDDVTGTVHLWFKDRYEYHPVYPIYTRFPDDEVRDTNCVHAAMVELKTQGAADFWMVGDIRVPSRLFAFEGSDIMHEEQSESVRTAMDILNTQREFLRLMRLRARREASAVGGAADGSRRAHAILNQREIRRVLSGGSRLYNAQRQLARWGSPLRERFRQVYFDFLGEIRAAIDESLALSRNDHAAEREEESAYGESLLLWMEASPMQEAAMSTQASFTAAFQGQETNLTAVLTNLVPTLNFALPGTPARARNAIDRVIGHDPSLTNDPARDWRTGPVPGLANAALAQINRVEQIMDRGRLLLRAALARLAVWLQAPAQPIDVADRVDELFHTRDAGYGQLLRERLQLMLDNIEGRGRLFAHVHRTDDTAVCTTATTLGEMPRPYEFVFCSFSANLDSNASTLLHEVAHAVIPGRGSRGSAESGAPIDRAYAGERLMLRMTTEEALNNAESYAQLIAVLAGLTPTTIPTDTVTGCRDSGPWLDAMALAQSAHRRAWSHLEEARDALDRGVAIQPYLRTLIDTHLGTPSDTDLRGMLTDFGNLQREGSVWHSGHTFTCPPARTCPSNALAFDNRRIYRSGSVVSSSRGGSSNPRICPGFFNLPTADDRARAAHVIVSRSFGDFFLIHKDRVWGYAALALALYRRDIGAAPASSLAEHQAADQPPSTTPPTAPSTPPSSSPFSESSRTSPPPR
jgi:hypothetical protein